MKLSVIVPSYNEAKWLDICLPGILAARPNIDHEFIVVDDQSEDGTQEVLSTFGEANDDLNWVINPKRLGAAGSRNYGASLATGDILCFIDAHVWPQPGFFQKLAETAAEKKSIISPGVSQYRLLDPLTAFPEKPTVNWGGGFSFTVRKWWFYMSVNRHPRRFERRRGSYACGMTMTRELFDYLGGWVKLPGFWSSSDVAMCIKAWMMDVPILVETETYHFHGIKGFTPHNTPKMHEVLNRLYTAKVLFSDEYYQKWWRSGIHTRFGAGKHWPDESVLEAEEVQKEHDFIRSKVKRTDEELLEVAVYPTLKKLNLPRDPTRWPLG